MGFIVYRLKSLEDEGIIMCLTTTHLCGAGELGDGLGSLGDGVLGKLSRKEESDSGLHLSGGEGGLLVVASELGCLESDAVEDVVHEGVEDGDTSLGDSGLRVHLLEHLVDVRGVRLDSLLGFASSLLGGLSSFLSRCLGHCVD